MYAQTFSQSESWGGGALTKCAVSEQLGSDSSQRGRDQKQICATVQIHSVQIHGRWWRSMLDPCLMVEILHKFYADHPPLMQPLPPILQSKVSNALICHFYRLACQQEVLQA